MNAFNTAAITPASPALAMRLGTRLATARMGLAGYDPALQDLRDITGATVACLARIGGKRRPMTLASVGHRGHEDDVVILNAALAKHGPGSAAIWSVPMDASRVWGIPLGRSGGQDYVLALVAPVSVLPDLMHDVGSAARACWEAGGQSRDIGPAADEAPPKTNALGPDNPYGLTAAERRVCERILTGARAQVIARDMDKSIATIRTHLSRIYSKTGCAGMVEVLHLLQGTSPELNGTENVT